MTYSFKDEDRGQYYVIHIEGRFNTESIREIQEKAKHAIKMGHKQLLFDLKKTNFIDSSAIGLMLSLQKELMAKGGKVCLSSLSSLASRILSSCGALRIFKVYKSIEEAHTALSDKLSKEERGFYAVIKLPIDFSLNIVRELREAVDEIENTGHTHIVFDFEKTKHISSVGIGILTTLQKKLQKKGGSVYLVGISSEVRPLMETTNVFHVLSEYKTIDEIEEKLI